jgi:hypothetical protein
MRGRVLLATGLVLAGVFSLGLALGQRTGPLRLPDWLSGAAGPAPGAALPPSRPVQIAIPALGLDAPVHPVGLDPDGTIAAPAMRRADEAGWYADGPAPGQFGPAVIVGHVDDRDGPAVFHRLATLGPGGRIEVTRRDRQVATFQVTSVQRYAKAALPAAEVYGDFSRPGLRLITCGGSWDGGGAGYAENVVVFAILVRPG